MYRRSSLCVCLLLTAACGDPTPANGPPTAPQVAIGPSAPDSLANLVVLFESPGADPEGHRLDYVYAWSRDGEPVDGVTTQLDASHTARGETWTVQVAAVDIVGNQSPWTEVSTLIGNAAPGAPKLAITPSAPSAGLDDLHCTVSEAAPDPDGDAVTYTFTWWVDGEAHTGATSDTDHAADTVPAHLVEPGSSWRCEAAASDGELDGPVATSSEVTATVACQAASGGTCWYIEPKSELGSGTWADPWGLDALRSDPSDCDPNGDALTSLLPGDVLYFLEGEYDVPGCSDGWFEPQIAPAVDGTESRPITLSAYPGAQVHLVAQPSTASGVIGSGEFVDWVRVIGFEITPDGTQAGVFIGNDDAEVAYNRINGHHHESSDRVGGIEVRGDRAWVHHNDISGHTGTGTRVPSIQMRYGARDGRVEHNHVSNCGLGIRVNNSDSEHTIAHNWVHDCTDGGLLTSDSNESNVTSLIHDNALMSGGISISASDQNSRIHDNLVLADTTIRDHHSGPGGAEVYNNIGISQLASMSAWNNREAASNWDIDVPVLDHNIYSENPEWRFGSYTSQPEEVYTLAEVQTQFMRELNSTTVVTLDEVYDTTTWTLNPAFVGTGRFGDDPGPDDLAAILDPSNYGPDAR